LFTFDEGISNSQRSRLVTLVKQEGTDRIEIANTNEHAAELGKEAAEANVRAAEVMKATAWRGFTAQQASGLKAVLSRRPGKILLGWVVGDPESLYLAIQFNNLLHTANRKWDVAPDALSSPNSLVWGIWIPNEPGSTEATQILRKAFTASGMQFKTGNLPKTVGIGWGVANPKVKERRALIFFGSKQPTFLQPAF
jgi:hypothetical protein